MKQYILLDPGAQAGGGSGAAPTGAAPSSLLGGQGNQGGDKGGAAPTGGAPIDWRADLPDDIKSHASLASIQSKADLAKSFIHAQTLVGSDKMLRPQDSWKPDDARWGDYHKAIGCPDKPEGYELKLPQGSNIPEDRLKEWATVFHGLHLPKKAVEAIMTRYHEQMGKDMTQYQAEQLQTKTKQLQDWENETKAKFGAQLDEGLNYARGAITQFGGDELTKVLDESGLGSHPAIVEFFAKVGKSLGDAAPRGANQGTPLVTADSAKQEIAQLKSDEGFMKKLHNDQDAGHVDAVKRWTSLFAIAYPKLAAP